MTFKEQLIKDYPWLYAENVAETIKEKCPSELGFISRKAESKLCDEVHCDCKKCWNSEVPNTEERDELKERLELIDELKQVEYNKGLNDAWEFMKKWDNMAYEQSNKIFKSTSLCKVLEYTPQEALAKLKAYEDSKIEVGDVLKNHEGDEILITCLRHGTTEFDGFSLITGSGYTLCKTEWFEKTGKHIDIKSILE